MAELPSIPKKNLYAVAAALGILVSSWAGQDFLDEVKARTGWTWLGAASVVLDYAKAIGLGLTFVTALIAASVFVWLIFRRDEGSQRERLIAAPAADAAAAAAEFDVLEYLASAHDERDTFQNETLNIPDLISPDDPVIRNKTFIDCSIVGPATIEFTASRPGAFAMTGSYFSDTDAVLYRNGSRSQTGISFEDCRFVKCRFHKTLLLFPADAYDAANEFIEGLNWITEPPSRAPPPPPVPEGGVLAQVFQQMQAEEAAKKA